MEHVIEYASAILLLSASVVLLTIAAHIPYWSKTDRIWKEAVETKNEDEEKKPIE